MAALLIVDDDPAIRRMLERTLVAEARFAPGRVATPLRRVLARPAAAGGRAGRSALPTA